MYEMTQSGTAEELVFGIKGYGERFDDLSKNRAAVEELITLCNREGLAPWQLRDIAEDFVQQDAMLYEASVAFAVTVLQKTKWGRAVPGSFSVERGMLFGAGRLLCDFGCAIMGGENARRKTAVSGGRREKSMNYLELDTPSLLIDRELLTQNLRRMQNYADRNQVALRPHTKTHKSPDIARMQLDAGAVGIAVAKVGEAEVMAAHGIRDIFIANEIVGRPKLERIRRLAQGAEVSFGVDSPCQVLAAGEVFAGDPKPARVLVEIEVGEGRSGVIEEADFLALLDTIRDTPNVLFCGIFSHDGNSYSAESIDACRVLSLEAQRRTLRFAALAAARGMPALTVSIGSTPPFTNEFPVLDGITELRVGTYALMDASQGAAVGTLAHCAATVLATVISRPTAERVILDVGAKGLTMQSRSVGICATPGKGTLADFPGVTLDAVFDEHGIIYNRAFREAVSVGDKVRVIPVHICPVCNLYDTAYLISDGEVVGELPIACRGKLQ